MNSTQGLNSTLSAVGSAHVHSEDVFQARDNLECQPETCSEIVGPTLMYVSHRQPTSTDA